VLLAAFEYTQLCASTWQSACVDELEQNEPAPVQPAGAALQVQAALPAAPVHVWCAPQAACVVWTVTQPCASATHVVTPPASQYVPAPCEQIAGAGLHTHDAEPAPPEQVSFDVHVVAFVALTKRQLFASRPQVDTLPPSQNGPVVVHVVALHSQAPVPPLQAWCAPQLVVPAL
jgi:hypothetical protein